MAQISKVKENGIPILFFDSRGSGYWLRLGSNRFLLLDSSNAKMHLREGGYSAEKFIGSLNEIERELWFAQVGNSIDYAGPLAGHRCGLLVTSDGGKVLVTSEPKPDVFEVPTSKTRFPKLEKFLGELLGQEQFTYFLAWAKCARHSLYLGDFRPGQMLVLAGPSGCGKSLLQALITEFLGGRMAKPYRYMIGETTFNAELAAAEHLMIEDEHASVDIRARRKFGAALKDFTVNQSMSIHAKGRQAIILPTFKRISLSVNDEPENLMILPPLDASILDKLTFFKCSPAEIGADRKTTWHELTSELPAFASYLAQWKIPRSMRCSRFGVQAFHNAELLQLVGETSPETRLLALLEEVVFAKRQVEWDGTAEELERELRCSPFAFAVEKLLYFSSACGVYLARLAHHDPQRFICRKHNGKTLWTIKRNCSK